ncbi:hypothetical protein Bca52824_000486 [Brassica carinata]|uniref:Uncharacterized protein n=1 Tax=Brassica carinata TaxID=52824 RepID=A0A8X7WGW8_BRACI|nr:hypothetical protein Bca52824_000486 [Brassica carinata]
MQIGKTKIFLRAGQMAELDARRTEVLSGAANKIQRQTKNSSSSETVYCSEKGHNISTSSM